MFYASRIILFTLMLLKKVYFLWFSLKTCRPQAVAWFEECLKFRPEKLLFKMATQEDPKLTSSHRHAEFRDTYGQIFLLRKPKVRLSGKQEGNHMETDIQSRYKPHSPHSEPQPGENSKPRISPQEEKLWAPHWTPYLSVSAPERGAPKALTLKANRLPSWDPQNSSILRACF